MTEQEAKNRLYKTCGDEFSLIGTYTVNYIKVKVRHNCPDCNYYTWDTIPKNTFLKKKLSCPRCSNQEYLLDRDNYLTKDKLIALLGKEYSLIDEVKGRKSIAIAIKHNSKECDNKVFYISPQKIEKMRLSKKTLCPVCRNIEKKMAKKRL